MVSIEEQMKKRTDGGEGMNGTPLFIVFERDWAGDDIVAILLSEAEAKVLASILQERVSEWDFPPLFEVRRHLVGEKKDPSNWQRRIRANE